MRAFICAHFFLFRYMHVDVYVAGVIYAVRYMSQSEYTRSDIYAERNMFMVTEFAHTVGIDRGSQPPPTSRVPLIMYYYLLVGRAYNVSTTHTVIITRNEITH